MRPVEVNGTGDELVAILYFSSLVFVCMNIEDVRYGSISTGGILS